MLERTEARAISTAETHAAERRSALADQLRAILPSAISVLESDEGVWLSGPGLGARLILDSSLRWTIAGLLR
jgi:hypothetical protein